jgi:hypothetical protein
MPWSGSGVYTRGYASWTSDASNGLPISATKFDTEDNDFAAGIQNCLTIDGQNKPNATLTWAQTLALTKGTDSTVFSIARTGGSNNPSLIWSVADSADTVTASLNTGNMALVFNPTLYTFGNTTDNPAMAFDTAGLTVNMSNVGGRVLTLNGCTAGQAVLGFQTATVPYGYLGTAGAVNQLIIGSGIGDLMFRSENKNILFSTNAGTTINAELTSAGAFEISDNAASPTLFNAGYMDAPQNNQNGNYSLVLSDRGKSLWHNSGSAHTYTIPANASVPFPSGTCIIVSNATGAGNLTIAITSDTLTWANNGSTGSRTLGPSGICVLYKQFATGWQITGPGLS